MMAFANNCVVSIIHNGKVQREFNSLGLRTVRIPFDSEYKIKIQNKKNVRVLADVLIDGISIFSSGSKLILSPYQSIELERFVDDLKKGNKFKFVSAQKAESLGHQDPTSSEFGNIEVVFQEEIPKVLIRNNNILRSVDYGTVKGVDFSMPTFYCSTNLGVSAAINSVPTDSFASTSPLLDSSSTTINTAFDSGIGGTVEGSSSNQSFSTSNEDIQWSATETRIKIKMLGGAEKELPDIVVGNKVFEYQWKTVNPDGSLMVMYK